MYVNNVLATALLGATSALGASLQPRASLQQVNNFGNNPTGTQMFIYVPAKVAAKPAILLGVRLLLCPCPLSPCS
jgi:acetylxylan esterase